MSVSQTLADNLLVPACGYYVRDRSGGFYRQHMVSGIVYLSVFHAGALMAHGRTGKEYNTVIQYIWCANGAWENLFGHFSEMSDLQDVSMDGSVIRAHACAAGAANSTADNEALGEQR